MEKFILLILTFYLIGCCEQEEYTFKENERLLLIEAERDDKFTYVSNNEDTITYTVYSSTSDIFVESAKGKGSCYDKVEAFDLLFTRHSSGIVAFASQKGLEYQISLYQDSLYHYFFNYKLTGFPNNYTIQNEKNDTLHNASLEWINDYSFNDSLTLSAIKLSEYNSEGEEVSRLILSNELGILEFTDKLEGNLYKKIL